MHLIDEREGRFDVLVNNAGIGDLRAGADGVTAASTLEQPDTNAVGGVRAPGPRCRYYVSPKTRSS